VGFLILIQKQNRTRYPLSFIGYICMLQCCSIWSLRYGLLNQCEYETVKWVQNWLITPESWVSRNMLGGRYLFGLSALDISGGMIMLYPIMYNTSICLEMVVSMCLNLDVISTIHDPFKRNENLKKILFLMRLSILVFCLLPIYTVSFMVSKARETTQASLHESVQTYLADNASIYVSEGHIYNFLVLYGTIIYALVSIYSLTVMTLAYCRSSQNG